MRHEVVEFVTPEDALRAARDLKARAEHLLTNMDALSFNQDHIGKLKQLYDSVMPGFKSDMSRHIERAFARKRHGSLPRKAATEMHAVATFIAGHRTPQQLQRVRVLLEALTLVPDVLEQELPRRARRCA